MVSLNPTFTSEGNLTPPQKDLGAV